MKQSEADQIVQAMQGKGIPVTVIDDQGEEHQIILPTGSRLIVVDGQDVTGGEGNNAFPLLNADGSEAEISGNGIRCLGQDALRAGGRRDGRIVIGARLLGRDATPGKNRFGNKQADFWVSWACGARVADSQSGQRYYPRAAVELPLTAIHNLTSVD